MSRLPLRCGEYESRQFKVAKVLYIRYFNCADNVGVTESGLRVLLAQETTVTHFCSVTVLS